MMHNDVKQIFVMVYLIAISDYPKGSCRLLRVFAWSPEHSVIAQRLVHYCLFNEWPISSISPNDEIARPAMATPVSRTRLHIFWFEAFEYEMLMEGSSLPKSKRINSRLSLTVASC